MTDTEILIKAMEKAKYTKIGFLGQPLYDLSKAHEMGYDTDFKIEYGKLILRTMKNIKISYYEYPVNDIIFDHSFAKAFWGAKEIMELCYSEIQENGYSVFTNGGGFDEQRSLEAWEYHLRQLVLEEEPLKYIAKFIKK